MNNSTTQYKRCTSCGQVFPITYFWKSNQSPDGHEYGCKFCRAAARKRRQEMMRFDVASLSDEALITELKRRGFSGELCYSHKITI